MPEPRVFDAPPCPDDLARVRDAEGDIWNRRGDYWCFVTARGTDGPSQNWREVIEYGPLTEVFDNEPGGEQR